jgi:hypothetical protein
MMAQPTGLLTLLVGEARPTDAVAAANSHLEEFGDKVGVTTEEIFHCLSRYATETRLDLTYQQLSRSEGYK